MTSSTCPRKKSIKRSPIHRDVFKKHIFPRLDHRTMASYAVTSKGDMSDLSLDCTRRSQEVPQKYISGKFLKLVEKLQYCKKPELNANEKLHKEWKQCEKNLEDFISAHKNTLKMFSCTKINFVIPDKEPSKYKPLKAYRKHSFEPFESQTQIPSNWNLSAGILISDEVPSSESNLVWKENREASIYLVRSPRYNSYTIVVYYNSGKIYLLTSGKGIYLWKQTNPSYFVFELHNGL
eukprot:TRINITY_DN38_c0_g1_i1.p1 TRINITY_DN38_c0_g1~~TRINITY_DN38_c0_g1_i1.p1  ORF type:complete len:247 (+),score=20.35 TRINITY_DN38_c0_g1_i1:35-742(+)